MLIVTKILLVFKNFRTFLLPALEASYVLEEPGINLSPSTLGKSFNPI